MKRISSLFLTFALVLSLCACGQKAPTWQEQYDLGVHYLSEGNYEEAIIAFTAAIEIDPKQPDAYFGLADVYIAQGNVDTAREVLEEGQIKTGDEAFQNRLKELEDSTGLPQIAPASTDESVTNRAVLDVLTDEDISILNYIFKYAQEKDYTALYALMWPDPNEWFPEFRIGDIYEKIGHSIIYDGNSVVGNKNGSGLMIRDNSVWYGTFKDGLPQGYCDLLTMTGGSQPTSYVRVSGIFTDGKLNGYGEVCSIYHDNNNERYNAKHVVCDTWVNDVAVGEVEERHYVNSRVPDIYAFSTNSDGTYNFQDERFIKEQENLYCLYVEREDGSRSGLQFWIGEGYPTGVYNTYAIGGDSGFW